MAHRSRGLTLIEILVVIGIIAVLCALLLPAVQAAREASRRIRCENNLRQIGMALQQYHHQREHLPSGWTAESPAGPPGWAWASYILPLLGSSSESAQYDQAIGDPGNQHLRELAISTYLCASDPAPNVFMLYEGPLKDKIGPAPNPKDHGRPLFQVSSCNYSGVFGVHVVEDFPSEGDGMFFHNSRITLDDVTDGLGNTIMIGERSSRLSRAIWIGAVPRADRAMARVVGRAGHVPNHVLGDFSDFSSYHPYGANFLLADGSLKMISDEVELAVYQAMATRAGAEALALPAEE